MITVHSTLIPDELKTTLINYAKCSSLIRGRKKDYRYKTQHGSLNFMLHYALLHALCYMAAAVVEKANFSSC